MTVTVVAVVITEMIAGEEVAAVGSVALTTRSTGSSSTTCPAQPLGKTSRTSSGKQVK